MKRWLRKDLRDVKNYQVNEEIKGLKLDANESPYGLPKEIMEDFTAYIENDYASQLYPDTDCSALRKELSKKWNVPRDQVIVGVGSDQLIDYLCRGFLEPGEKVLVPYPSFSMYGITAKLNHGQPVSYSLREDFSYPVDTIIERVKEENPKLLFLCTPNNPTGNILTLEEIEKIAKEVDCILVVDEAYAEFCEETAIDLVEKYPQMIVLRTFSKAWGLASLRIGYGIGSRELIECLGKVKAPYNVNTLSQQLALQVLLKEELRQQEVEKIIGLRDEFVEAIKPLKAFKLYPSKANFLLIQSKVPDLDQRLRAEGILIRAFKEDVLKDCYRVSIGNEQDQKRLIAILKKISEEG